MEEFFGIKKFNSIASSTKDMVPSSTTYSDASLHVSRARKGNMKLLLSNVGEKIMYYRNIAGYSREELVNRCNNSKDFAKNNIVEITIFNISALEKGNGSKIGINTIGLICDMLSINPSDLFNTKITVETIERQAKEEKRERSFIN